jgi:hypothetical protein
MKPGDTLEVEISIRHAAHPASPTNQSKQFSRDIILS